MSNPKMFCDLKPIRTPNYVLAVVPPGKRQDGFVEGPKWHVKDIPAETLAALCDQFRKDLFEKAGKADPAMGGGE